MAEKKFGHNIPEEHGYHLNQPLPEGVPTEILKRAKDFLAYLDSTKTTTHPVVRALYHGVELQIAGLTGLAEVERLRKLGPGKDEMDGMPLAVCPKCKCLICAHHGPGIGCEGAGGNCGCMLTIEEIMKGLA